MSKLNVEAEGGELILQNENGDYSIIPKKDATRIQMYMKKGQHDRIDNYVSKLPLASQYAEDGTVIPDYGNDPILGKKQTAYGRIPGVETLGKTKQEPTNNYIERSRQLQSKTPDKHSVELPSYKEQKQWMDSYISSPMYKEMLTNEYRQSGLSIDKVDSEIMKRRSNVKTTPIIEGAAHPKGYGYTRGIFKDTKENTQEIDLETNKPFKTNTERSITIDPLAKKIDSYIATHELTHASTRNNNQLTEYAKNKTKDNVTKDIRPYAKDLKTGNEYGYWDDPTEVHARLTELKFILNKHGVYDARKEKFNEDHLNKFLSNPNITKIQDVKDLLKMFDKKGDLLDVMNKIAYTGKNNFENIG